jgi:hypothetical protein
MALYVVVVVCDGGAGVMLIVVLPAAFVAAVADGVFESPAGAGASPIVCAPPFTAATLAATPTRNEMANREERFMTQFPREALPSWADLGDGSSICVVSPESPSPVLMIRSPVPRIVGRRFAGSGLVLDGASAGSAAGPA